ncbi:hypothetical protein NI17_023130 [Thermobifida halotolerans]|uniref:Uncharacterized protein n=1 Tax=Thermobifida halotolerans TaxID=483545 RepID=A0A399FZC4_9ACTN|nr:hypothetical protein [Thermobifida halotolerans]UOE22241.1 hypothetical protein NI17_023130 [Thermobifida halotolerans]
MRDYEVNPVPELSAETPDGTPAHYVVSDSRGRTLGYVTRALDNTWLVSALGHGPGPDTHDLAEGARWVAANAHIDEEPNEVGMSDRFWEADHADTLYDALSEALRERAWNAADLAFTALDEWLRGGRTLPRPWRRAAL